MMKMKILRFTLLLFPIAPSLLMISGSATAQTWQRQYGDTLSSMKVNDSLQWDSINTAPFKYDSLCPYAIATDTVPLVNCTGITAISSKFMAVR
ncbi:MAG: hypothetical protein NT004_19850 [Bacteroidetes bacterium]|nr:hypothetical protein [Bacteroidota bacterium]